MITATQLTEHQDYIYNVAYRFTQDPIDAEDLKQDVILDLLENPDQYHGTAKITTFLYSVIKHRFYYTKRLHINSRTDATHFDDSQGFTPTTTSDPESIAVHAEQRQIVQERHRIAQDRATGRIITLRGNTRNYPTMKSQTNWTSLMDNVKYRLHTARQALKKAIAS